MLFFSALAGVPLLFSAWLLVQLLFTYFLWKDEVQLVRDAVLPAFPYLGTSLLAFVLGCALWKPINLLHRYDEQEEFKKAVEGSNDFLEILLDKAQRSERQVSVTMRNRKVYIGWVARNVEPSSEQRFIQILTVASGFRWEMDLRLRITHDYTSALNNVIEKELAAGGSDAESLTAEDFTVVLPVSDILSVTLFDWRAYAEFRAMERRELGLD